MALHDPESTESPELDGMAACLALIGAEIHRRVADGDGEILLDSAIHDLAEELDSLYDGVDWLGWDYDTGEIWDAVWTTDLLRFSHDWGFDRLSMLDFGSGHGFVGFDTNNARGFNHEIVAEVDLADDEAIREVIRGLLSLGLGGDDYLGKTPDSIWFDPPVTGSDIRSVAVGKFMALEAVAEEYAAWMEEGGLGTWPVATEIDRAALADAYLEVVLGHSPGQYSLEIHSDEGGGMLLSELLESGQADLDRIEDELGRLRAEMADPAEPAQGD